MHFQTSSTERSRPRLLSYSSIAPGKANTTSPVSPVNTPPCPSCPSPFRMSSSHIATAVSSWSCIGCRYVVCNPMINKWLLLPDNLHSWGEAHLGFDPTVSSHLYVFEYRKVREGESVGVSIYSSKSAAWIFKESKWGDSIIVSTYARSVFLNGFMH